MIHAVPIAAMATSIHSNVSRQQENKEEITKKWDCRVEGSAQDAVLCNLTIYKRGSTNSRRDETNAVYVQ